MRHQEARPGLGCRLLAVITEPLASAITARLDRRFETLERLITNEGKLIMSDVDIAAASIENAEAPLLADLARELGDLQKQVAGSLTDEQKARFQAVVDKLTQADADINAADPASQPPAPSDV